MSSPSSSSPARVELLRVELIAYTLHRDEAGRIVEERPGPRVAVHSVADLERFWQAAELEVAKANAELEQPAPNRRARRAARRLRRSLGSAA